MKKLLAIELYELQFEKKYLLAFVDDRNKELFTKEIPKSNREELLTTIKEQLQLYFEGRLTNIPENTIPQFKDTEEKIEFLRRRIKEIGPISKRSILQNDE